MDLTEECGTSVVIRGWYTRHHGLKWGGVGVETPPRGLLSQKPGCGANDRTRPRRGTGAFVVRPVKAGSGREAQSRFPDRPWIDVLSKGDMLQDTLSAANTLMRQLMAAAQGALVAAALDTQLWQQQMRF
ncbi:hypothetical protein VaNZ11_015927 [Volvox africanus]|uniref:Uncharacterized protein n=1 Tax=Volvox africanus TaxID=51714 RepID=A0ABQ5SMP2_9CHLO|nr:hypothetical protein VaNZ11_015927 [Volvox africanus]